MTNILEAIYQIVHNSNRSIKSIYSGRNRANSIGESLEMYLKDAFANTFSAKSEVERMLAFEKVFSWSGNQNQPPDFMIKGGDAVEVKKIQSPNSDLALNSSYPKSNIESSSPMITKTCKDCEEWTVKDLIYCVGHTSDETVKSIWMLYGSIYAAEHETYQRIKRTISDGVKTIPNVEFSETKELGRVNRVDPLGITNLRIRGMWQIKNPKKVFGYLNTQTTGDFQLCCLIPKDKYNSFPKQSIEKIEKIKLAGFNIQNVKVKNPNNPVKLTDCKLITFSE